MYRVNVVDSICGSGKSTAMINFINNSPKTKKFLYITPFLDEVTRIINSCYSKDFKQPREFGTKMRGLKYLLEQGENIVTTHALFHMLDEETINLVYLNEYTLILDEVSEVVGIFDITEYDLNTLLYTEKYVEVAKNNQIIWTSKKYKGEFEKYKKICDLGSIYFNQENKENPYLTWIFPISVFEAFKEIYILTYLFDAQFQKCYYDYYDIKYNRLYIKDYNLTDIPQQQDLSKYRDLINICNHEKLNYIGEPRGSLSYSWYNRNNNDLTINTLKNNCVNYFKHICNTPSDLNMWTTFKGKDEEFRKRIKGTGYAKGFIHVNARATNNFIHKQSIAYLVNKYMNPMVKKFFTNKNIEVNEDLFALSELIQFVFRSRLRVDEPVNIYLPSRRMRDLLTNWMNQ